jgi:hypothetical protein
MTAPVVADVVLSEPLTPEMESEIEQLFAGMGATVRTRVIPSRRGPAELSWLVLATIPLEAFLKVLAEGVASDVHVNLRALLQRLSSHRREHRPLVLRDPMTRLQIVLEADLPAAAYRQLVELDLSQFDRGPLHYDMARSR